jgi:hypothetical protein
MGRSSLPGPGELDATLGSDAVVGEDAELPVVARLVVEIRSDGTRTIARGAIEDPEGIRVAVVASGSTPWALAKQLAGALWTMPRLGLGRPSLRALLSGRRGRSQGG